MSGAFKRPIKRIAYRRDEAAAVLGIGTTKFDNWVKRGLLPRPIKIDDVVLYDAQALSEAWARIAGRESVDAPTGWQSRSGL